MEYQTLYHMLIEGGVLGTYMKRLGLISLKIPIQIIGILKMVKENTGSNLGNLN